LGGTGKLVCPWGLNGQGRWKQHRQTSLAVPPKPGLNTYQRSRSHASMPRTRACSRPRTHGSPGVDRVTSWVRMAIRRVYRFAAYGTRANGGRLPRRCAPHTSVPMAPKAQNSRPAGPARSRAERGRNRCRARCRLRTSSCPPGSSFARNRWCLPLGGLTARLCPRNHGTRRLTEGTTRRPILVTPAKAGVQPTSETRMCSRIGHNPHAHAVWIPAPDRVRGKLCAGMTESCRAGVLDRNDRVVPTGRRHRFLAGSGPVLACHLSHITCHGLLPNLLLARPAINADCLSSTSLGPPRDGNPAGSTPGNNLWLVAGGVLKRHPAGSVPVRA
jgi:hypothetical protein